MEPLSIHPPRPQFRTAIGRGLRLRCPCCGRGPLYQRVYRMYHECPLCGLEFYRESGYYVGAMIVNYGFVALVMIIAYLISRTLPEWWHAPINTKILAWMGSAAVLSLILVPVARSLWLAIDYFLEPWPCSEPLFQSSGQSSKNAVANK